MKPELLAPAGSFSSFKQALYSGADAIYLATMRFGARAYAKNLTMEELEEALSLAHCLNKKIYVTVNTILKENELAECKEYLNSLYIMGVDGLILADLSMIYYALENLKGMEIHISTQCGIKDLEDLRFFEKLKVQRCVIARECSIEEIKKMKMASSMPLEVFAYGALCVSYSGGCLFSSMLSLRSGNRGRCSQNCRREYQIYKNNKLFKDYGYHLSMRDLNTIGHLHELKIADSLKIEGRMKASDYVKVVTETFRNKLDQIDEPSKLESVFHRKYTKGFIFDEDRGAIVDPTKKANEGAYIGKIATSYGKFTKLLLTGKLQVKDRIKIVGLKEDYYFTIDKMYNEKEEEIAFADKTCLVHIFKEQLKDSPVYKMIDSSIDLEIKEANKRPLSLTFTGQAGEYLVASTKINEKIFTIASKELLSEAKTKPLDEETLFKQFAKLKETSFYLAEIDNQIKGQVFITLASLNELRRNLVLELICFLNPKRTLNLIEPKFLNWGYAKEIPTICCKCETEEQYQAILEMKINDIYYQNVIPYVNAKYNELEDKQILAGNYGAINYYQGKAITADYSLNAINSETIYRLLQAGCRHVCLSLEMDYKLLEDTINSFVKKYEFYPPVEMVVYGHQNLMTMKYCPLKKYQECGKCQDNKYYLKDEYSKFILRQKDCITYILNDKTLNLVDELKSILKYVPRIRLDFTVESKEETKRIIKMFLDKLNKLDETKKYFDSSCNTRGYFKRPIL